MDKGELRVNAAYKEMEPKAVLRNKKPKEANDFVVLPSSLFDLIIATIKEARNNREQSIHLRHDGHSIVGTDAITLATT